MSAWSEVCGSLEIKRNFASAFDCSLWSCHIAWPMSCCQMELIQVSAHVQKYTASWIMEQVRCVFIIFLNVIGCLIWLTTSHGKFTVGLIY